MTIVSELVDENFQPELLDQVHDTLKLVGVVLGQMALIDVVNNPLAKPEARVTAAKALMQIDEAPERIAERLRKSVFSRLSVQELGAMIEKVKKGETNLKDLIEQSK